MHPSIADKAAAYLYHISQNHPFFDGNKRTALAVMEAFLRLNGYNLDLSDEQEYDLVLRIAKGELEKSELSRILSWHLITEAGN